MSVPIMDIAGQRFGRLVALRLGERARNGRPRWECQCDCGNITTTQAGALKNGSSKSCGCYQRDRLRARATTHGATHHPLFKTWQAMMKRCYNANYEHFQNYGGRGIRVCRRWRKDPHAFFADMGPKPSSRHSIDRRKVGE